MITILIGAAVKGTVVLVAAWALSLALRRASAASRHLVWTLALGSLLLLPVFSWLIPGWDAPVRQTAVTEIVVRPVSNSVQPAPAGVDWLFGIWLAGAMMVAGRVAIGTAKVWWLSRHAVAVCDSAVTGKVRILRSDRPTIPLVWGLWRPVILLPAEADGWPAERREVVLSHELAHVARRDCWTQMMAQTVCALYWFHPGVWFAAHQMRKEREQACDDLVLSSGTKPSEYAGHLLEVARSLQPADSSLIAVAMARRSHFEDRLLAILEDRKNRRPASVRFAVLGAAMLVALIAPLAAMRPAPPPGTIEGTIYDISGAVVPGAEVMLLNTQTAGKSIQASGAAGEFRFASVTAGRYQLSVGAPGFRGHVQHVTMPESGSVPPVDIVLQLGGVRESIQVRASGNPAPPRATPRRIRVGGNVVASKRVWFQQPEYPERARSEGIEGAVLLRAIILMDGSLGSLQLLSAPSPELAKAAADAVQQWRYQPTLLNGQPVEIETTITVNFELEAR